MADKDKKGGGEGGPDARITYVMNRLQKAFDQVKADKFSKAL